MNQKEIKELIEFLVEKDIAEFELQRGDVRLLIKRGTTAQPPQVLQVAPAIVPGTVAVASAPATPPPAQPTTAGESSSLAASAPRSRG